MDILYKKAKALISYSHLVIKDKEYEIVALCIHHESDVLHKTKRQRSGTWHISFYNPTEGKNKKYIDIDMSDLSSIFRLRIEAIRDKKTGDIIAPAGKVYDEIRFSISDSNLLKYSREKISKNSTPKLYLKKSNIVNKRKQYIIPRRLGNTNKARYLDCVTSYLDPLMVTNDLSWFAHKDIQAKVISLYILKKYGVENYDSNMIPIKKLKKYAIMFDEGKKMTKSQIDIEYKRNSKHTMYVLRCMGFYRERVFK